MKYQSVYIVQKAVHFMIWMFFGAAFIFLLNGCKKDSPTEPQPSKPPGYQEDIPWPSLADSPWPMYRADPHNTGRSKSIGALSGSIVWSKKLSANLLSSGVIGADSTLYICDQNGLLALTPGGIEKWRYNFSKPLTWVTPLLTVNQDIIIHSAAEAALYSISKNGSVNWKLNNIKLEAAGINIGKDGTLYFIQKGKILTAVSKEGALLWTYTNQDFVSHEGSSIVFSPDGQTLYINQILAGDGMAAFDLTSGSIKWRFGKTAGPMPIVDDEGSIYILANHQEINKDNITLFCLREDSCIKWYYMFDYPKELIHAFESPALDKNGNIYIGYDTLFSISYSGKLNWKEYLNGWVSSPITSDADGNIYLSVNSKDNPLLLDHFISFNAGGHVRWRAGNNDPEIRWGICPVIGFGNFFYITDDESSRLISFM